MARIKSQFERIFGRGDDAADGATDPVILELHSLRERIAALETRLSGAPVDPRPADVLTPPASQAAQGPTEAADAAHPMSQVQDGPPGTPPPGFEDPAAYAIIATNTAMLPQPGESQDAYEQRLIGAGLTLSQALPTLLALEADGALPTSIMADWSARKSASAAL